MKVFYVFNEVGKNEVFSKEELGVENVGMEEWEDVEDFESDIIEDYKVYDGVWEELLQGIMLVKKKCQKSWIELMKICGKKV